MFNFFAFYVFFYVKLKSNVVNESVVVVVLILCRDWSSLFRLNIRYIQIQKCVVSKI